MAIRSSGVSSNPCSSSRWTERKPCPLRWFSIFHVGLPSSQLRHRPVPQAVEHEKQHFLRGRHRRIVLRFFRRGRRISFQHSNTVPGRRQERAAQMPLPEISVSPYPKEKTACAGIKGTFSGRFRLYGQERIPHPEDDPDRQITLGPSLLPIAVGAQPAVPCRLRSACRQSLVDTLSKFFEQEIR